jgi:hypothetical protein
MNVKVHRKKQSLGLIYGLVAGLAFPIFAWGADAWLLALAHYTYYYVKFIPGLIICVLAGGISGWLTITINKHAIAIILWSLLSLLYTWLAIWLPFSGQATITRILNSSLAHWFNFSPVADINQFIILSVIIIGLASIIGGLLEINLIDQAILSPYESGMVFILVVGFILFGLAGSAVDHMINTDLREPVKVINNLLQFAQDHFGLEVPKETAREMHLSATQQLGDLVQKTRQLFLIGFDGNLGMVDILVDFSGTPVKCTTIFSQPTDCTILTVNP